MKRATNVTPLQYSPAPLHKDRRIDALSETGVTAVSVSCNRNVKLYTAVDILNRGCFCYGGNFVQCEVPICGHFVQCGVAICGHFVQCGVAICGHFVQCEVAICGHFVQCKVAICGHFLQCEVPICGHFLQCEVPICGHTKTLHVSALHCHPQGAFLVPSERCSIEQSIEHCGWAW
jgi:hypothetical protein